MKKGNWSAGDLTKLFVSLLACLGAGFVGSVFTIPAITGWYAAINKPWFTPPDWLFGPAWTFLFILMAFALFFVWRKGFAEKNVKTAVALFALQLVLNVLWSLAFFGLQSPALGFAVIIALWLSIFATITYFRKVSRSAGLLLAPYIAWVSFAACLNLAVWMLNP
ncbi:MAG: TspO/MBR family protein [Candidatus Micrarchaeia archaeon]|jgi:tryptophan-rich sensory protein